MPTIVLARHAQAQHRTKEVDDFERNVIKKGEEQAQVLRTRLESLGLYPDLGMFSPAVRTQQTLQLLVSKAEIPKVEVPSLIYMGENWEGAKKVMADVAEEAPFSECLSHEAGDAFRRYAQAVALDVRKLIEERKAQVTFIVGHSATINAVALGLYGDHELVLGSCPEYAQGFIITEESIEKI